MTPNPPGIVAFIRDRLDEDEQTARLMAQFFPSPWDVSDRGYMAKVDADEPHFRTVTMIEQWPGQPTGSDAPYLGDMIAHVARWDPARVLAEVSAKRAILAEILRYEAKIDGEWGCCCSVETIAAGECPETPLGEVTALLLLAAPFSDHSEFDPSWLHEETQ
jgi:hypothetical protein